MDRQEALDLANKYTENKNLVKHMLAVEAAMASYGEKFDKDVEKWRVCGLLHDFDYEKMEDKHPSDWGIELLKEKGVDPDIIEAIRYHGPGESDKRTTQMAKTLFAVDELTGFIVACALVRPNKLADVDFSSVENSMKKKEFAKAVSRQDLQKGADDLGVDFEEHVNTVLDAMKGIQEELGLWG
jgi:putative nucleotidyltransferase with HDIG domain